MAVSARAFGCNDSPLASLLFSASCSGHGGNLHEPRMSTCMTKEVKIWSEHVESKFGLALQLNRLTKNLEEMF